MISRNEGLKLAVNALFQSIPELGNVTLITGVTIFFFSILGINFFKGRFYHCEIENSEFLEFIKFEEDCLQYKGIWKNQRSNFDNIFIAMETLFEMTTTEGWTNIM